MLCSLKCVRLDYAFIEFVVVVVSIETNNFAIDKTPFFCKGSLEYKCVCVCGGIACDVIRWNGFNDHYNFDLCDDMWTKKQNYVLYSANCVRIWNFWLLFFYEFRKSGKNERDEKMYL